MWIGGIKIKKGKGEAHWEGYLRLIGRESADISSKTVGPESIPALMLQRLEEWGSLRVKGGMTYVMG